MCVSKSLRPFSLQSALVPARQPERKYLPWCGFVRGSVLFSLKEVLIYINASKSAFVLTRSWERQLRPDSWHFSAPYLGRTPPAPCPGAQCEDMSGNPSQAQLCRLFSGSGCRSPSPHPGGRQSAGPGGGPPAAGGWLSLGLPSPPDTHCLCSCRPRSLLPCSHCSGWVFLPWRPSSGWSEWSLAQRPQKEGKMDSHMLLNSTENECSILHFILPSRVINVSPHIQSRDFILYLLSERIWKTDVMSGYSYSFYKMSICIYGWTVQME